MSFGLRDDDWVDPPEEERNTSCVGCKYHLPGDACDEETRGKWYCVFDGVVLLESDTQDCGCYA